MNVDTLMNGHVNFLYFSHCHTLQHNNPRTPQWRSLSCL